MNGTGAGFGGLWKAGTACVAITPSEPMWLAGWAARRQPSEGKALDLFAKALALEDLNGQRAVIVTLDLIAVPRSLATRVAAEICRNFNITPAQLLFNASHTHTAPEVRPDKVPFFEIPTEFGDKIAPYVADLQQKLVQVIGSALKALRPVRLFARQTTAQFARNRRAQGGPVDWTVPILEVTTTNREPLGILFCYACHNLTLPPQFCKYHGDYAGVAQAELQRRLPGATAFYLAGAGADQDPAPRGTMELAELHGHSLAEGIARALSRPGREVSGSLGVAYEEVPLDFQPLPSREALEKDAESADTACARKARFLRSALTQGVEFPRAYPCPVQVLRLGNEFLLVALGGEPVVDYALQFRTEISGPLVCVAGYCNDGFGYLPNRRIQAEGGYEGGRSLFWSALPGPFTDRVEERISGAVRRLVGRVRGEK